MYGESFFLTNFCALQFLQQKNNDVKICLDAFVLLNVGVVGGVPVHHAAVAPLLALAAVS